MSYQTNTGPQPSTDRNSDRSNANLAEIARDQEWSASEAAWMCLRRFAQERPEVVALWSFGFGFVLGWKLKIW